MIGHGSVFRSEEGIAGSLCKWIGNSREEQENELCHLF